MITLAEEWCEWWRHLQPESRRSPLVNENIISTALHHPESIHRDGWKRLLVGGAGGIVNIVSGLYLFYGGAGRGMYKAEWYHWVYDVMWVLAEIEDM
jgi:hypothetical protein